MAASNTSSAYLTVKGCVYVFGLMKRQVFAISGSEDKYMNMFKPEKLSSDDGDLFVGMALGTRHMLLRTLNGKVKSLGEETFGQLGCFMNSREQHPFGFTRKALENGVHSVVRPGDKTDHFYLSAHRNSSAIFTTCGLYTFGRDKHGELGHGKRSPTEQPTCVDSLRDCEIVGFGISSQFSAAVVRRRPGFA